MKDIYERVDEINEKMKSVLLHHNDLHSSNVLLCDNDTNSPDICIIDFGEASYGPTEKI
jgi:Ser/Thr protein kinase RdoA (MazF antagonist)